MITPIEVNLYLQIIKKVHDTTCNMSDSSIQQFFLKDELNYRANKHERSFAALVHKLNPYIYWKDRFQCFIDHARKTIN
jgi:hypothetical protein